MFPPSPGLPTRTIVSALALLALGQFAAACADEGGLADDGGVHDGNVAVGGGLSEDKIQLATGGATGSNLLGGEGGVGAHDGDNVCRAASSSAELAPVLLAFAFDVSGSMGMHLAPEWWYDSETKWKPVVAATRAFFEADDSEGISASLALFPSNADGQLCSADAYESPEVGMAALPSNDFGQVFADYEQEVGMPLQGGDWRGGTPTEAAFRGTAAYLQDVARINPGAQSAVVLVTDGEPMGCGADGVDELVAAVAELNQLGVRTYVIGIENPRQPPEELPTGWDDWGACDSGPGGGDEPCLPEGNLNALNSVAEAGGTDAAFLIDTGDPSATQAAFSEAIGAIRGGTVSCSFDIPQHPIGGMSFEAEKIDVSQTLNGETERLRYDPACEESPAWRYDDEESPTRIELCAETCEQVQSDPDAKLSVQFLCEPREEFVK